MTKTKMKGAVVGIITLMLALVLTLGAMNIAPKSTASAETITKEVLFNGDEGFSTMKKDNITIKSYTGFSLKVFATADNTIQTGSSQNKYGYRADRLQLVLKLDNVSDLILYVSNNSEDARNVKLCKFSSIKDLSDIAVDDYSSSEDIAFASIVGGSAQTIKNLAKATLTSENNIDYSYTTKGGAIITYNDLPKGYYVVKNSETQGDHYLNGINVSYEYTAPVATLNVNGGTVVDASLSATDGKVTLPTPTAPEGYTFIAWTDGTTAFKAEEVAIAEDKTFTALYAKASYSFGKTEAVAEVTAARIVYTVEFNAVTDDQKNSLLSSFVADYSLSAAGEKAKTLTGTIANVKYDTNKIQFAIQVSNIPADKTSTLFTSVLTLTINNVKLIDNVSKEFSYDGITVPVVTEA